jgi:hypothetical protein
MMLLLRFGPRSASDLNEDDDDDDDDDDDVHADDDDDKYENRRGSIMMGNIEIGSCEQRAQAAPPITPPRNRLGTEEFKKPTKVLIFKNNNALENNNDGGGLGGGHIQTSILPGLQNSQRSTNTNNNYHYNAEDGASLYTVTGESIENASLTETTPILYQQQQQQLQLEQQQLQQQSSSSNNLAFIKNGTPRIKNSLLKKVKKKRASQVALASIV